MNLRSAITSSLLRTNDAATKSTSFSIPNKISLLSRSLKYGIEIGTLGRFMPFLSDKTPPHTTLHSAKSSPALTTQSSIFPSSRRIFVPSASCDGSFAYVTLTSFSFPSTSFERSVKISPSLSVTLPFLKVLTLISGPFVSSISATGLLRRFLTFLTVSILSL